MKILIPAAAATLFAAAAARAQQAVQWRIEEGGNGHWYQFVRVPGTITWPSARLAAAARNGELGIVDSAQLTGFLNAHYPPATNACFIGCHRVAETWRWVDDQPVSWTNWCPCGQPSGDGPVVELWAGGYWNDVSTAEPRQGYLIEWSADCNHDGIVDYGQVLRGELPDTDGNGTPDCCDNGGSCCVGDIFSDGQVNGSDLEIMLSYWGPVTSAAASRACDLNHDGVNGGADLGLLLTNWGPCPN